MSARDLRERDPVPHADAVEARDIGDRSRDVGRAGGLPAQTGPGDRLRPRAASSPQLPGSPMPEATFTTGEVPTPPLRKARPTTARPASRTSTKSRVASSGPSDRTWPGSATAPRDVRREQRRQVTLLQSGTDEVEHPGHGQVQVRAGRRSTRATSSAARLLTPYGSLGSTRPSSRSGTTPPPGP